MKNLNNNKGFNLIELMVSMTIMTFVFLLSVPSYAGWMSKMRVRNNVEGINLGIIQARAEAIRRNSYVTFVLNSDTSWQIIDSGTSKVLDQKTNSESSKNIGLTVTPTNSTTLTFNGFGFLTNNVDSSAAIQKVVVSTSINGDAASPLTILVGTGGSSLVCDAAVTDTADFRYCRVQ